jgi:hypothetical protein
MIRSFTMMYVNDPSGAVLHLTYVAVESQIRVVRDTLRDTPARHRAGHPIREADLARRGDGLMAWPRAATADQGDG